MNKSILNKFSLKNKKAFIFGGCGLIGREITKTFVEAGANIFVFVYIEDLKGPKSA